MLIIATVKRSQAGFSLVELMFAIVMLAVFLAIAMPSFRTWIQNIQIRNAAESILNGIQRARGEAVTRNSNVEFVLNADSSWTVILPATAATIESRPASEGSESVTRTVLPAGASTITFNNLGLVVGNADASPSLNQVDVTAPGGNRDLRVTIGVGGSARMCNPSLPPGSNPTAC